MQKQFLEYLNAQLYSEQWAFFLRPVSQELMSRFSDTEMRSLARSAGMRAGRDMSLPICDSLEKMERAANEHWSSLGWGFVRFEERSDHLAIEHNCAPLLTTLGEEALSWAAGFLEGVYQEWFLLLGAGSDLQVTQVGEAGECFGLEYRLGR